MTETSPTTRPATAPDGCGTELPLVTLEEAIAMDSDNPNLRRVIANLQGKALSAFQSATS